MKPIIGQIGMGWIGSNYAKDFEERGYEVIKYDVEKYIENKNKICFCDIVFIAVPTPTTPEGFDYSIIDMVLNAVGKGKIAVIKSTILPGTTKKLQEKYPDIFLMHSPEFLTEATAYYDVKNPCRNIIGVTEKSASRAGEVMNVLPVAPYEKIMPAEEAELTKYGGNCWFYFKVVFMNMLYDLAKEMDIDYEVVRDAMAADKRIGRTHLDTVHKGGRGAGGHCFIKDMAAFMELYSQEVNDLRGMMALRHIRNKNVQLLKDSGKDLDLLEGVYGKINKN